MGIPEFQSFGTVVGQNISGALAGKVDGRASIERQPGRGWPRSQTSRLPEVELFEPRPARVNCREPAAELDQDL